MEYELFMIGGIEVCFCPAFRRATGMLDLVIREDTIGGDGDSKVS